MKGTRHIINGNHWFKVEGEWVVITKEMLEEAGPEMAKKILRIYDVDRKCQERETKCIKPNDTRCMEKCGECKYFRSGQAVSVDLFLENGAELASVFSVENYVIAQETYRAVRDFITMLSLEDQQILRLLAEGLSGREVGRRLGIKQKTASNRIKKIRKGLKAVLKESSCEK